MCIYIYECVSVSVALSIEVICLYVGCNLCLPFISVVEQLLLVVKQLFVGLSGELKVRALIHGEGGGRMIGEVK